MTIFADVLHELLEEGFEVRFEKQTETGRRLKITLIKDKKIIIRETNWGVSKEESLLKAMTYWQYRFGNL